MDEESDSNNFLQMNHVIADSNFQQIHIIQENCAYHTTLDKTEFTDTLSVLHMNVRSMKNKAEEIQNFLRGLDIEFDAICISETWFKDEIVKYYGQEKYNLFAFCRSVGAGVCTAIYILFSFLFLYISSE